MNRKKPAQSQPAQNNSAPGARAFLEGLHPMEAEAQEAQPSAPVTPSAHLLSVRHQRFCQEYLHDLNGTEAYKRTYPGASHDTARSAAATLLGEQNVRNEIQRLLDERAAVTGITADRVLLRLWEQATFDPRQLVEVIVGSCRHCWGEYHQYQYTEAEFERAEHEHIHNEAKRRKAEGDDFVPKSFPRKGGTGYDPKRPPHPECPECHGDGEARSVLKDTRQLSPAQSAMFAGVKYDNQGNIQVLIRDQHPALIAVAKHLGMLSDKLPGPTLETDPLTALLEEMRGKSGTAAALPVVMDDPERRSPKSDIEDVTPKEENRPDSPAKPKPAAKKPGAWRAA